MFLEMFNQGSSFTGELISAMPNVSYYFEPLWFFGNSVNNSRFNEVCLQICHSYDKNVMKLSFDILTFPTFFFSDMLFIKQTLHRQFNLSKSTRKHYLLELFQTQGHLGVVLRSRNLVKNFYIFCGLDKPASS